MTKKINEEYRFSFFRNAKAISPREKIDFGEG
jgi:hypothetical protein